MGCKSNYVFYDCIIIDSIPCRIVTAYERSISRGVDDDHNPKDTRLQTMIIRTFSHGKNFENSARTENISRKSTIYV